MFTRFILIAYERNNKWSNGTKWSTSRYRRSLFVERRASAVCLYFFRDWVSDLSFAAAIFSSSLDAINRVGCKISVCTILGNARTFRNYLRIIFKFAISLFNVRKNGTCQRATMKRSNRLSSTFSLSSLTHQLNTSRS